MAARAWREEPEGTVQHGAGQHSTGQDGTALEGTTERRAGHSAGLHSAGQHAGNGPTPTTFLIPPWYARAKAPTAQPCLDQGQEVVYLWAAATQEEERAETHRRYTNLAPGAGDQGNEARQGRAEGAATLGGGGGGRDPALAYPQSTQPLTSICAPGNAVQGLDAPAAGPGGAPRQCSGRPCALARPSRCAGAGASFEGVGCTPTTTGSVPVMVHPLASRGAGAPAASAGCGCTGGYTEGSPDEELLGLQRKLLEVERMRSTAADHCERFLDMLTHALAAGAHPPGGDRAQGAEGGAGAGGAEQPGQGERADRGRRGSRQSSRQNSGQNSKQTAREGEEVGGTEGEGEGQQQERDGEAQQGGKQSSSVQSTACEGVREDPFSEAAERRLRERQRRRRRVPGAPSSNLHLHPSASTVLQQYHLEDCSGGGVPVGGGSPLWHTTETQHSTSTATLRRSSLLGICSLQEATLGLRFTGGPPNREMGEGGCLTAGLSQMDLLPQRAGAGPGEGAATAASARTAPAAATAGVAEAAAGRGAAAGAGADAGAGASSSQRPLRTGAGAAVSCMRTMAEAEFLDPRAFQAARGPSAGSPGGMRSRQQAEKEFLGPPQASKAAVPSTAPGHPPGCMRSRAEKEFLDPQPLGVPGVPSTAPGAARIAAREDFLAPQVIRGSQGPDLRRLAQHRLGPRGEGTPQDVWGAAGGKPQDRRAVDSRPQDVWGPAGVKPQDTWAVDGTPQDVWVAEGGAEGELYDLNRVPRRVARRGSRPAASGPKMPYSPSAAADLHQFAEHQCGAPEEQFLGGGKAHKGHEGLAAASFYYGTPLDSQQAPGQFQADGGQGQGQGGDGAQGKGRGQLPEQRRASLDQAKDWTPGWRRKVAPWSTAQRRSLDVARPTHEP